VANLRIKESLGKRPSRNPTLPLPQQYLRVAEPEAGPSVWRRSAQGRSVRAMAKALETLLTIWIRRALLAR
jgi:hypothetical protein